MKACAFWNALRDTWTDLNSFMITHLWWHLALFYLSQGREDDALDAYDRHCWGVDKDYSQDQVGAISLLARLELAGISAGERWRDIGEHLASRAKDTVEPFLTMQYLYGLARASRPEADILMASVRERAQTAPDFDREAWHGRRLARLRRIAGACARRLRDRAPQAGHCPAPHERDRR